MCPLENAVHLVDKAATVSSINRIFYMCKLQAVCAKNDIVRCLVTSADSVAQIALVSMMQQQQQLQQFEVDLKLVSLDTLILASATSPIHLNARERAFETRACSKSKICPSTIKTCTFLSFVSLPPLTLSRSH